MVPWNQPSPHPDISGILTRQDSHAEGMQYWGPCLKCLFCQQIKASMIWPSHTHLWGILPHTLSPGHTRQLLFPKISNGSSHFLITFQDFPFCLNAFSQPLPSKSYSPFKVHPKCLAMKRPVTPLWHPLPPSWAHTVLAIKASDDDAKATPRDCSWRPSTLSLQQPWAAESSRSCSSWGRQDLKTVSVVFKFIQF